MRGAFQKRRTRSTSAGVKPMCAASWLASPPTSRPPMALGWPVSENGPVPGLPMRPVARWQLMMALTLSAQGTDKVNAIINCHLACGRIGRPGLGPFSVTGQPNAMGGREVGGLANQLAAHMGFDDPADVARVQRFWGGTALATRPGLKAVDLFDAVHDGRIKALWIMATNPAASLPRADHVRQALEAC